MRNITPNDLIPNDIFYDANGEKYQFTRLDMNRHVVCEHFGMPGKIYYGPPTYNYFFTKISTGETYCLDNPFRVLYIEGDDLKEITKTYKFGE
jgi:hypothetical protein